MNVATACRLVLYHTVYGPVAAIVREDTTPQGIANLFVLDRDHAQNVDVVPFGTGEGCWSWPERQDSAKEAQAPAPVAPGVLVPAGVPGVALSGYGRPAGLPATSQTVRDMSPDPNQYAAPAGQIATSVDQASEQLASDPATDGEREVTSDGVENIL